MKPAGRVRGCNDMACDFGGARAGRSMRLRNFSPRDRQQTAESDTKVRTVSWRQMGGFGGPRTFDSTRPASTCQRDY